MTTGGGRAVVVGAGMAGLLTARVLSESHARVTVLDRDRLPGTPVARRGVPQGRHPHGVLARGREVFDELFPGLTDELVARGATTGDMQADVRWYNDGHLLRQEPIGLRGIAVSRPLLEDRVRARVRALPGVEVREGADLADLVLDGSSVTGVDVVRDGRREVLPADLVVDASGRGSHTPTWLAEHGWPAPAESRVVVDVRYTTWILPRRPGDLGGDLACVVGATAAAPRFGAALAMEGDRWQLAAGGYAGEAAPVELDAFREFLTRLPVPDLCELVADREPLEAPRPYRFHSSVRRHYEKLDRCPRGLLVTGDALSSFNPVYGQGMTVAAVEALLLRRLVAEGADPLARAFWRGAARAVDAPWDIAAGADLRLPPVPGARPLRVRAVNAYVARVQAAAEVDGDVGAAFLRVANLIDPPPALMRPAVAVRALRAGRHRRRPGRPEAPAHRTVRLPHLPHIPHPRGSRTEEAAHRTPTP
ncbi:MULTISPECIES: FAD-dependent monooxygenase [unclassified Blastococcus]